MSANSIVPVPDATAGAVGLAHCYAAVGSGRSKGEGVATPRLRLRWK